MAKISLIPKFLNPIIPELSPCPILVQSLYIKGLNVLFEKLVLGFDIYPVKPIYFLVGVHGFKGSAVQGSILVPGMHLECRIYDTKASALSGLIQNLGPPWQLFWKISISNQDFRSLMPSLSLTLNL